MIIDSLCPPAVLYLGFSIVQIVIDLFRGQQNIAFLKVIVMIIFTILLNQLCMNGMTIVSWLIVFIPFITMTYMTTILLYVFGLNPTKGTTTQINNNNKQQDTQPNSRNCNLSTHGCCLDEVTAKIDSTGSNCVVKPHKENSKKYFTYPYFESSYLNYFSKKSSDKSTPTSSPTPTPTSKKTSSTSTTTAPSTTPTPTPTTILASSESLPLTMNLVFGETATNPLRFNVYAKDYAAGSVTITYQWFRKTKGASNYVIITGQSDNTLPIVATVYNESTSTVAGKFSDGDSVKCVANCTVNSFTYTLESGVTVINVKPFRIINEPASITYSSNTNTIKVDVKVGKIQSSGSVAAPPPTFNWMKVNLATSAEMPAPYSPNAPPNTTTDSSTNIVTNTFTIPSDLSIGIHYYYCNISATFGTVKTIDTKQITVTK